MQFYFDDLGTYYAVHPTFAGDSTQHVDYREPGSPIINGGYDGDPNIVAANISSGAWMPASGITDIAGATWSGGRLIGP